MTKSSLINKNINTFFNSKKKYILKKNIKKELKNNFSLFLFFKLQKIKKKNLIVKFIRRCYITGRGRSVYSRFDLNRNLIRKLGTFGYIIGLKKSSW